jgi:NadR type nicotinamide-nucleotide adenylyltransferase
MSEEISIKKIVAIGPESTGKSFLCEQLAKYYNTLWCPEYARIYLTENGKDYTYDDLLLITIGQLALEDAMTEEVRNQPDHSIQHPTSNAPLLFVDTDMYVMKVWCEYVFDKCHQFILNSIAERKYDLYLLCNVDLPWTPDELREYPEEAPRKELYNIYKNILINQETPWIEISGNYEERFQKAVEGIEKYIL